MDCHQMCMSKNHASIPEYVEYHIHAQENYGEGVVVYLAALEY